MIEIKRNIFAPLPQYYFERDKFCEALFTNCTEDEYTEFISEYEFTTSSFIFKRVGDEFYVIHMDSGIIINWYKHLGRTNTCNASNFTYDKLVEFFKLFIEEWREEIRKIPVKQISDTPGPDINSIYPSIMKVTLNSIYGTTKGIN